MRKRAMLLLASVTVVIVMLVLVGCQYTGTLSWMPSDIANYKPPHIGERDGVKVLTVAMFEVGDPTGDSPGEAQLWIEGEKLDQVIEVPGSYSPLYCNAAKDHCLVICGKGKANAASDWHGEILLDWAEWWTKQFTSGQGNYGMSNMEDTGTLTALSRLAAAGRIDLDRVMVLRTASDFDQPYPGQTALQSLQADSGGYMLAIQNAYRVGSVVAQHIITHWDEWKDGVPPLS